MSNPERGPSGTHDRKGLFKKLSELLRQIFSKKMRAKIEAERRAKEGKKARRERASYETKEKRGEEENRWKAEDETRAYHDAKSAEIERVEAQVARARRAEEVKRMLNEAVRDFEKRPLGSDYLLNEIGRDENLRTALIELIERSSSAAEAINSLIDKEAKVHGKATKLIILAHRLSHEASKEAGTLDKLRAVFKKISSRTQDLIIKEVEIREKQARRERKHGPTVIEILEQDPGVILTEEEKRDLRETIPLADGRTDWKRTKEKWKETIDKIVTNPREPASPDKSDWVTSAGTPSDQIVIGNMVAPIDKIWGEIERREGTKEGILSVDDLVEFSDQIKIAESQAYPKDIPAGTDDYNKAVQELGKHTDERLNLLAEKLKQRLREETPVMKEGIDNEKEFLLEMIRNKGRLGGLLKLNPEMEELFLGTGERSGRFRTRIFLKIHSAILSDQRNASRDNFGLYERADFTTFVDLIRMRLELIVPETGETLGKTWVDHFNNLSSAIRQSRDIDFWASQPGANIENFNKSLGMFQNEYTYQATGIPAVVAAFHAYEVALRSIIDTNDGYLPPALIEYNDALKGFFWDNRAKEMLVKQMISAGAVPDLYRDPVTYLHQVNPDGHTLRQEGTLKLPLSEDEISMYMVLAKGIGMSSLRYIEIMANTRVAGSKHPEYALEGFRSMPYENLCKAMNYFNVFVHKWKIGSYRYFHLLNLLIPEGRKIKVSQDDITEGVRAFMAYQKHDGTFEKEFGEKAKRFIDLTNFSGCSSALGKTTQWRQYDSTIDWSDKQRELLGGPTQLILIDKYIPAKVKDFLVVDKYKEEYRQLVIENNKGLLEGQKLAISGPGFAKLWREYGESKYSAKIAKEWDKLMGKDPLKGLRHTPLRHETKDLIKAYEKAFIARLWVEMAMRNPLVVAHNLKVDIPLVAAEGTKKTKLHNLLIQEILDIPLEDTKYGEKYGRAGYAHTPTIRQQDYMKAVLLLEGDLAAVKEKAVREGRDLRVSDFNIIKDEARKRHALKYWQRVRQVILGTDDLSEAGRFYDNFGLKLMENGEDYEWDSHKIHKLMTDKKDGYLDELEEHLNERDKKTKELKRPVGIIETKDGRKIRLPFLLKKAIETKHEWILGTDDMAMGKMDWLNLGSRQWLRRGGDVAAHHAGSEKATLYLTNLKPSPDKHKLAEALLEMRDAYSGDMIEVGWKVGTNLAYMTDRLFALDYKRFGSAAQLDVWKTRRNVAAWTANGRREWWDILEHMDVFPPNAHFYGYEHIAGENIDIHTLRKMCHADNVDVWKEIITLGILIALAMTLWRALTAPSEEEAAGGGDGGGGGGGHH